MFAEVFDIMLAHFHNRFANASQQRQIAADMRLNIMGRNLGSKEQAQWIAWNLEFD